MTTQKFSFGSICLILFMLLSFDISAQTGRNIVPFNSDWKFHKGDVIHGEAVDFADHDWKPLSLPHDWSIDGPFSQEWASGTAFLPAGVGWYRKTFAIPAATRN